MDISAVHAYSRMELSTPILLGYSSKKNWMANHLKKIKTHNGHIP
jgi:hypothetical protein